MDFTIRICLFVPVDVIMVSFML